MKSLAVLIEQRLGADWQTDG